MKHIKKFESAEYDKWWKETQPKETDDSEYVDDELDELDSDPKEIDYSAKLDNYLDRIRVGVSKLTREGQRRAINNLSHTLVKIETDNFHYPKIEI